MVDANKKTEGSVDISSGAESSESKELDWGKLSDGHRKKLIDLGFGEGEKAIIEKSTDDGRVLIFRLNEKNEKVLVGTEDVKTKKIKKESVNNETGVEVEKSSELEFIPKDIAEKYIAVRMEGKSGRAAENTKKDAMKQLEKWDKNIQKKNAGVVFKDEADRAFVVLNQLAEKHKSGPIKDIVKLARREKFQELYGNIIGKKRYDDAGRWMSVIHVGDKGQIVFEYQGGRKIEKRGITFKKFQELLKEYKNTTFPRGTDKTNNEKVPDEALKKTRGDLLNMLKDEEKKKSVDDFDNKNEKQADSEKTEKSIEKKYDSILGLTLYLKSAPKYLMRVQSCDYDKKEVEVFYRGDNGVEESEKMSFSELEKNFKFYTKDKTSIEGGEDEDEEAAENTPDPNDKIKPYIEGSEDAAEAEAERDPAEVMMDNDLSRKFNIKEDTAEAESQILEKLQEAVERARMGYASKDYEVTNIFTKIKKIFGGHMRSTPGNHPETHDQYNAYKIALTELLDYQVVQLKERNLPPEELSSEMEKLTKYYNQDEKVNMYEARTEARAQVMEEKFGHSVGRPVGWIMNGAKKFFHWYTKSEGKGVKGILKGIGKRGSFNGTLVAAGLGLSAIALPGAAVGTYAAKQVVGGVATGIGVTRTLEGLYRKKEDKNMALERKEIMDEIEKISTPEDKLAKLVEYLQPMSDGYDKDLRRELKNADKRKMIGAGVGFASAATLGLISHYFNVIGHSSSSPELMSSHAPKGVPLTSGHVGAGASPEAIVNASGVVEESAKNTVGQAVQNSAEEASKVVKEAAVQKAAEHATDFGEAVKGDSVWKMIGKHIIDNKEFSSLVDPSQKAYVIDALKDRVSAQHIFKNIDKIKIGDKLDFSKLINGEADFHSIVEQAKHLTPEQLKNIAHNNEAISHWVQAHHGQALTSPKVEEILSHAQSHAVPTPENVLHETPKQFLPGASGAMPQDIPNVASHSVMPGAETLADNATSGISAGGTLAPAAGLGAAIGRMGIKKEKLAGKKGDDKIVNFSEAKKKSEASTEKVMLKKAKQFEKLVKDYKFVPSENAPARAMKMIKGVAINSKENWDLMKGAKFSKWKNGVPIELITEQGRELTPKLTKNIEKLATATVDYLGKKGQPNSGETIFAWIARTANNLSEEEKKEDLKMAA